MKCSDLYVVHEELIDFSQASATLKSFFFDEDGESRLLPPDCGVVFLVCRDGVLALVVMGRNSP